MTYSRDAPPFFTTAFHLDDDFDNDFDDDEDEESDDEDEESDEDDDEDDGDEETETWQVSVVRPIPLNELPPKGRWD